MLLTTLFSQQLQTFLTDIYTSISDTKNQIRYIDNRLRWTLWYNVLVLQRLSLSTCWRKLSSRAKGTRKCGFEKRKPSQLFMQLLFRFCIGRNIFFLLFDVEMLVVRQWDYSQLEERERGGRGFSEHCCRLRKFYLVCLPGKNTEYSALLITFWC